MPTFLSTVDAAQGYRHGTAATPLWKTGTGTPEGAVTAPVGSIYSRLDGGTDTAVYRKELGTGANGWVTVTNSGTGGGGGGVTSVDSRTGDVVLSDLYVDTAGDTMTGPLVVNPSVSGSSVIGVNSTPTGTGEGGSAYGLQVTPTGSTFGATVGIYIEPRGEGEYVEATGLDISSPVNVTNQFYRSVGISIGDYSGSTRAGAAYAIWQRSPQDINRFEGVVELGDRGIRHGVDAEYSPTWTIGYEPPEGTVPAAVGSIYSNTSGGSGSTLYVKESNYDSTGWIPVGGAGGGGAVASVDGRTGDVVLSDLYVDITGDTMTGALKVGGQGVTLDPTGRAAIRTGGVIDESALLRVGDGFNTVNSPYQAVGTISQPANDGVGQVWGISCDPVSRSTACEGIIGISTTALFLAGGSSPLATGVSIGSPYISDNGTITDATGVQIRAQKAAGVVNGYGIRQEGANDINEFAGVVQGQRGFRHGDATTPSWTSGTGTPEGVVTARVGSLHSRRDGGTDTALYRKETGTGMTGWVAVANSGSGSGAVASVDGRTGAVTLSDLYVDVTGDNMTGNLGLGVPSPTAKLQFASSTVAAGGILFGTDVSMYRSGATALTLTASLASYGLSANGTITSSSFITAAGGGLSAGFRMNTGQSWKAAVGTPEASVTAPVGSIFSRTDGAAGTSFYIKESGAGNTGWVAVGAAAGGVTSVDGRTGVVALSDLYVNVAGDTMTGALDLAQYEIRNAVSHKLGIPPASPVEGQWYYDTTLKDERFWNGTSWVSSGTSADLYVNTTGDTMTGDLYAPDYRLSASRFKAIGQVYAKSLFPFMQGTWADRFQHGTISNSEYWDGSAWVALASTVVQEMFSGHPASQVSLNATTYPKWRVTFSGTGSSYAGLLFLYQEYSAGTAQPYKVTLEESNDGTTWSTLVAETTVPISTYYATIQPTLISYGSYVRITIEHLTPTHTYAWRQIRFLSDRMNGQGGQQIGLPYSWNYSKAVTFPGAITAAGVTSTTSVAIGANPATAGALRLTTAGQVYWRLSDNSGNGAYIANDAGNNLTYGAWGIASNPTWHRFYCGGGEVLSLRYNGIVTTQPVNLQQNELQNAVTHKLSIAPASPVEGQRYYDTLLKLERYWDGTKWSDQTDVWVGTSAPTGTPAAGDQWYDTDDVSGLVFPIPVAQGGTGGTSPTMARSSLSVPYVGNSTTTTGGPTTGTYVKGDQWLDNANVLWVCTVAGSPGTWMPPIGYELAYGQITSNVTVAATVEVGSTTVVTASTFTFDGVTPVVVEFYAPQVNTPGVAGSYVVLGLFQDGVAYGQVAIVLAAGPAGIATAVPVSTQRRFTPTAGAHTYAIRAFSVNATGGVIVGGPGGPGGGNYMPAFIRITRA